MSRTTGAAARPAPVRVATVRVAPVRTAVARLLVRAMLLPLRFYQRWISPALGPRCRFAPSCSHYAAQALQVHGPLRGSALAVGRLLRCHPWNPGGHDPVPPPRTASTTMDPAGSDPARPAPDRDRSPEPHPTRTTEPRSRAGAHP